MGGESLHGFQSEHNLTPVHSGDFMTGLLASLARLGTRNIPLEGNRFDSAVVSAIDEFERDAKGRGLKLMFRFRVHATVAHGQSAELRRALIEAAGRGVAGFSIPGNDLMIRIAPEDANAYLKSLPGPPEMYTKLAQAVLREL